MFSSEHDCLSEMFVEEYASIAHPGGTLTTWEDEPPPQLEICYGMLSHKNETPVEIYTPPSTDIQRYTYRQIIG